MPQKQAWEKEYQQPRFITNSNEPQLDFKHFVRWLRKDQKIVLDGLRVLDLGSGTGKNSFFLAERGSNVTGIELSETALGIAQSRSKEAELDITFLQGDMGAILPFRNKQFDVIIDVMSSNSLTVNERSVYLSEMSRVLAPNGYIYVKGLCKDGDKHATALLAKFPGPDYDTYIMPETHIVERVFSKQDITHLYEQYFTILKLERKSSYTLFNGKPFRRNFWLLYGQKKV